MFFFILQSYLVELFQSTVNVPLGPIKGMARKHWTNFFSNFEVIFPSIEQKINYEN